MKKITLLVLILALSGCTGNKFFETKPIDLQQNEGSKTTTLEKVKDDGRYKTYEGKLTVSGEYFVGSMGNKICFVVDNETRYLIPREGQDTRREWFCFKNNEQVKKQFGIDSNQTVEYPTKCIQGKAKVEISEYVVDTLEGDVNDMATLDKIISKSSIDTKCHDVFSR